MKYLPSTEWKMLTTFVLQQKDWNQSLIADKNLFMINLDNPAGNCKCQLIVMVLPALNTVHKPYFYNYLFCFNMTNKCENFGWKFENISLLTCKSTERGAIAQHINKL